MGYFKGDDKIGLNLKLQSVPPPTRWLWITGLAFAASEGTDGLIPRAMVPRLSDIPRANTTHTKKLLAARLWHDQEGYEACPTCTAPVQRRTRKNVEVLHPAPGPDEYLIHEYLELNVSQSEDRDRREAEAEKKRTQRGTVKESSPEGGPEGQGEGLPPDVPGHSPVQTSPGFEGSKTSDGGSGGDPLNDHQRYLLDKLGDRAEQWRGISNPTLSIALAKLGPRGPGAMTEALMRIADLSDADLRAVDNPGGYLTSVLKDVSTNDTKEADS